MFDTYMNLTRIRRCMLLLIVMFYTSIALSCSSDDEGKGGGTTVAVKNRGSLRFVFLADSRRDSYGNPPIVPANFINMSSLNPIVAQIGALSPRPAFVVFGGDMAYRGHYKHSNSSFYTFQAFRDVMAPLTKAGIPVYTTMGNHELYDTHPGTFVLANQTEFQSVFKDNPGNGPPGYERLVYSFTSLGGDAFFAVLDPYYITADTPDTGLLNGNIDDTQLSWLASQVAKSSATHKFLFIHTPYYYTTGATGNATLTKLWTYLDNNKFDMYVCGHSHLYSRKTVDSNLDPLWKNSIVQLLNGTCGAPLNADAPAVDASWNVYNARTNPNTYYFSVVDINGSQTTVNSYGYRVDTGTNSIVDSFTIQKSTSTQ